ncbi:hypothetical protein Varpa_0080 [Variovorax paradoxus EPS]|uniref:Uncharacterized protein n=1 Tax=Variovorax paradoxus (strain EPS) TaxID=595537 RepID=E6UYX4_VARPE|nr:hypothetical protein Varpa_0080 [Variovorax paradoxus EPS]
MGCLAQRNQGGGRRPGDIRFAVYPVGGIAAPNNPDKTYENALITAGTVSTAV